MRRIARLQRSLLPTELPQVSTLDLAVYSRTSAEAGGDYYNVLPLPRGRVGLLLADVAGHGAAAAMVVAVVHSLVTTYTGPAVPPGHLLAYVNDHLTRMSTRSAGTFVTAVYAVYDPDRATLTWANAGHPPPRLVRATGGPAEALTGERCVPLGVVDGTAYPEAEVGLAPGDQVLLHTDGVTDAKGGSDDAFGTDRLDAALARGATGSRATIGRVLEALEQFAGSGSPDDDYTLLAMTFVRSRKKAGEISGEWRAVGR
jgi:sigma-B regulation protein RsbU (phosphoserine phosphatase)